MERLPRDRAHRRPARQPPAPSTGSRTQLATLADVPLLLAFERTVGDEFQGVLDDPEVPPPRHRDAAARRRLEPSVLGVGGIEEPLPDHAPAPAAVPPTSTRGTGSPLGEEEPTWHLRSRRRRPRRLRAPGDHAVAVGRGAGPPYRPAAGRSPTCVEEGRLYVRGRRSDSGIGPVCSQPARAGRRHCRGPGGAPGATRPPDPPPPREGSLVTADNWVAPHARPAGVRDRPCALGRLGRCPSGPPDLGTPAALLLLIGAGASLAAARRRTRRRPTSRSQSLLALAVRPRRCRRRTGHRAGLRPRRPQGKDPGRVDGPRRPGAPRRRLDRRARAARHLRHHRRRLA